MNDYKNNIYYEDFSGIRINIFSNVLITNHVYYDHELDAEYKPINCKLFKRLIKYSYIFILLT